jgi:hypothetical protein
MTAADITNAVVCHGTPFSRRQWTVVPNVSWGWGLDYEADLIAISRTMRVNEIEVKISLQDLKNDVHKEKWKRGLGKRIHKFWYAVPQELVADAIALKLPEGTIQGVIGIWPTDKAHDFPRSKIVQVARPRADARKATDKEVSELYRLGYLRYWDLRLKDNK